MATTLANSMLLLPPQVYESTPLAAQLLAYSNGTALSIVSDHPSQNSQQVGNYSDLGGANDSIPGLAIPASGIVSGSFPLTFLGDQAPTPLNGQVFLSFITSDGFVEFPSNNGQGTTVVNPVNVGQLPGAPANSSLAAPVIEPILPAVGGFTSVAVVSFLPSTPGTGNPFNVDPPLAAIPNDAGILGYVATCMQSGFQSGSQPSNTGLSGKLANVPFSPIVATVTTPAFSAWYTTSSSVSINVITPSVTAGSSTPVTTTIALTTTAVPTLQGVAAAFNAAAPAGIFCYVVGGGSTGYLVFTSSISTANPTGQLVLQDGGSTSTVQYLFGFAASSIAVPATLPAVAAPVLGAPQPVATSLFAPVHGGWTAITTGASIKINGSDAISLGTTGTPTQASAVAAINTASLAGVYAVSLTATQMVIFGVCCPGNPTGAVSIVDGGATTNGLTVLGWTAPPASVVGGVTSWVSVGHATWSGTAGTVTINGVQVAFAASVTLAAAVTAINAAAIPGVVAVASQVSGTTTAGSLELIGSPVYGNANGSIVISDPSSVFSAATTSYVGLGYAPIFGLQAGTFSFSINAVSNLGNSQWGELMVFPLT